MFARRPVYESHLQRRPQPWHRGTDGRRRCATVVEAQATSCGVNCVQSPGAERREKQARNEHARDTTHALHASKLHSQVKRREKLGSVILPATKQATRPGGCCLLTAERPFPAQPVIVSKNQLTQLLRRRTAPVYDGVIIPRSVRLATPQKQNKYRTFRCWFANACADIGWTPHDVRWTYR